MLFIKMIRRVCFTALLFLMVHPLVLASITTTIDKTASDAFISNQASVQLQATISQSSAYIHQQVIYTVKLYSEQPLLNGEYHAPRIKNGLMMPLGEGSRYQAEINGRRFLVDEQQYALFPQKSGRFHIKPPSFNGIVYDGTPKQIALTANDVNLVVKPIPATDAASTWLPAKALSLKEHYHDSKTNLAVGNAFVRTVTIQAIGMPAELLPTLPLNHQNNFHVYIEQPPTLNNTWQDQQWIGSRTINITYLFHKPGVTTIPPLTLTWFNTTTGHTEQAVLPQKTLIITAKAHTKAPKTHRNAPPTNNSIRATHIVQENPKKPAHKWPEPIGMWIIASAIGSFITFGLGVAIWRHRHKSSNTKGSIASHASKEPFITDPLVAKNALLSWAKQQWPHRCFLNLNDIAEQAQDPILDVHIKTLSKMLYEKRDETTLSRRWNGLDLWKYLAHYRQKVIQKRHIKPVLPAMHP